MSINLSGRTHFPRTVFAAVALSATSMMSAAADEPPKDVAIFVANRAAGSVDDDGERHPTFPLERREGKFVHAFWRYGEIGRIDQEYRR